MEGDHEFVHVLRQRVEVDAGTFEEVAQLGVGIERQVDATRNPSCGLRDEFGDEVRPPLESVVGPGFLGRWAVAPFVESLHPLLELPVAAVAVAVLRPGEADVVEADVPVGVGAVVDDAPMGVKLALRREGPRTAPVRTGTARWSGSRL